MYSIIKYELEVVDIVSFYFLKKVRAKLLQTILQYYKFYIVFG
jgi:hypothetical protein